eukprot:SAG11_NODE_37768_length_255_cov_0.903846_2_plen_36_part_01
MHDEVHAYGMHMGAGTFRELQCTVVINEQIGTRIPA